jgi:hypothetical protein
MVLRIIFDQVTANHCWMRPSRSTTDDSNESVPMTTVYNQISGSKIRYDRNFDAVFTGKEEGPSS